MGVDSPIKVDLVLMVELMFSRRCEPIRVKLRIRVISGGRAEISGYISN